MLIFTSYPEILVQRFLYLWFVDDRSSSGDRVKKVINFIRSHVHAAELEQNTQQEMTFVLPDNSVKRGGFETFFTELEQKKNELEIDSFGLTDTALEEVRRW